jgi:transposase
MSRKQEHRVELSEDQRKELTRIVVTTSKKVTTEAKTRAKVLLCLDETGESPQKPESAAAKCKIHRETVYSIRKQFAAEGLESAVYRKKRESPPVEPKVTGDVEAHIVAIACSAVPEGKSKWTLKMIADKIVMDGVVESIGKETVRRTLKKRGISLI